MTARARGNLITTLLAPISATLRRLASVRRKEIPMSGLGEQVVRIAEAQGYHVARSTKQGPEAIVFERDGEGSIFLWSNEDVIAYGRSRKWI